MLEVVTLQESLAFQFLTAFWPPLLPLFFFLAEGDFTRAFGQGETLPCVPVKICLVFLHPLFTVVFSPHEFLLALTPFLFAAFLARTYSRGARETFLRGFSVSLCLLTNYRSPLRRSLPGPNLDFLFAGSFFPPLAGFTN